MQLVLAFHVIFVVAWFAGLFYLPRLFVYHAEAKDQIGVERFKVMERRLYYGITMPAGILATVFGFFVLSVKPDYYFSQPWMLIKLALVALLWVFHFYCGHYVKLFKDDKNPHTQKFYRFFNEVPTVILIAVVILVFVKP